MPPHMYVDCNWSFDSILERNPRAVRDDRSQQLASIEQMSHDKQKIELAQNEGYTFCSTKNTTLLVASHDEEHALKGGNAQAQHVKGKRPLLQSAWSHMRISWAQTVASNSHDVHK